MKFPNYGQRTIIYWTGIKWEKTNISQSEARVGLMKGVKFRTKQGKPLTTDEEIKEYYDTKH